MKFRLRIFPVSGKPFTIHLEDVIPAQVTVEVHHKGAWRALASIGTPGRMLLQALTDQHEHEFQEERHDHPRPDRRH
jgi:hypothetical protein